MSGGYTPGPWAVDADFVSEVNAPNGLTVATSWHAYAANQTITVRGVNPVPLAESAANARLIAAAPEMADVLRALEKWFDTDEKILAALPEAERADNARQLAKILTVLAKAGAA